MPRGGVVVEHVCLCAFGLGSFEQHSWTGRSLRVMVGGSDSPASLHCGLCLAQC